MAFILTAQIKLQGPQNAQSIVNQINRQLQGVTTTVNVNLARGATRQINNINKQLNTTTKESKKAADGLKGFGEQSALALRRFGGFVAATFAFRAFINSFNDGIKNAIHFERELIRVAQVSGRTLDGLKDLTGEIRRVSTVFGVTSSSLLQANRILAQTGLSVKETKAALDALGKAAISPTFGDIIKVTEGSIAIFRQFGKEAKDLEGILSSINSVSSRFAVESEDIITAVRRTGGAFEAAGGKLEDLIGLFTSVRATTRESAESIATGFRTIFTRLQRTRTINFLETLGIDLRDVDTKQFIGPFEAIRKLSKELNKISPTDSRFAQITEELGGFRQVSKVIPLIKEFTTAEQARAVALRGTNSLAKDAAIAQKSLAIQFQKVREEFAALTRDIVDSTGFRALTNIALGAARAFIKVADAIRPLIPLVGALAIPLAFRGAGQFLKGFGPKLISRNSGGIVPGTGNRDTVPALLTPGEFVLRKSAVQTLGSDNVRKLNRGGFARFAEGGELGENAPEKVALRDLEFLKTNRIRNFSNVKKDRIQGLPQLKDIARSLDLRRDASEESVYLRNNYGFADRRQAFDFLKQVGLVVNQRGRIVNDLNAAPGALTPGRSASGKVRSYRDRIREVLTPSTEPPELNKQFNSVSIGNANAPVFGGAFFTLSAKNANESRSVIATKFQKDRDASKERPGVVTSAKNSFGVMLNNIAKNKGVPRESLDSVGRIDVPLEINVLSKQSKEAFTKTLDKGLSSVVSQTSRAVAGKAARLFNTGANERIDTSAIEGQIFEAVIGQVSGTIPQSNTATFDFPQGLGNSKLFPNHRPGTIIDAKRTLDLSDGNNKGTVFASKSQRGKGGDSLGEKVRSVLLNKGSNVRLPGIAGKIQLKNRGGIIQRFGSGGSVVPALLTPGEFVVNKQTAKRVGSSNLNRLNNIEKFANGGLVGRGIQKQNRPLTELEIASIGQYVSNPNSFNKNFLGATKKARAKRADKAQTFNFPGIVNRNTGQRNVKPKDLLGDSKPTVRQSVGALVSAINSGEVARETTVFRGVGKKRRDLIERQIGSSLFDKKAIGKVFRFSGAPSASISEESAKAFGENLFAIRLKAGRKLLDLSQHENQFEQELLLQLGSKFKILRANEAGFIGSRIDVQQLASGGSVFKPKLTSRGVSQQGDVGRRKQFLIQRLEFLQKKGNLTPDETEELRSLKARLSFINSSRTARFSRRLGFAGGGFVPGEGNRDTVPALLSPGEFVLRKRAVQEIGEDNVQRLNKGGLVGYQRGGIVNSVAQNPVAAAAIFGLLTSLTDQFASLNDGTKEVVGTIRDLSIGFASIFFVIKQFAEVGRTASNLAKQQENLAALTTERRQSSSGVQESRALVQERQREIDAITANAKRTGNLTPQAQNQLGQARGDLSIQRGVLQAREQEVRAIDQSIAEQQKDVDASRRFQKGLVVAGAGLAALAAGAQILQQRFETQAQAAIESGNAEQVRSSTTRAGISGGVGSGLSFGTAAGVLATSSISGPIGLAIGTTVVALSALVGGIIGYTSSIEKAEERVRDVKFKPIFDRLTNTLSLIDKDFRKADTQITQVTTGLKATSRRLIESSPEGRQNLVSEINTQLPSLNKFFGEVAKTSNSLEQFKSRLGDLNNGVPESLLFFSEFAKIPIKDLLEQFKTTIEAQKAEAQASKAVTAANNFLANQNRAAAVLASSLDDAKITVDLFSSSLGDAANFASGAFAGLNLVDVSSVFNRVDNVGNFSQFSDIVDNATSILGPSSQTLANQIKETAKISQALPQILFDLTQGAPLSEDLDLQGRLKKSLESQFPTSGSKEIRQFILNRVRGIIGSEGKEEKFLKELRENFPQTLETITQGFNEQGKVFAEALKVANSRLGDFAKGIEAGVQNQLKLNASQARVLDVQEASIRFDSKLNNRRANISDLTSVDDARITALSGGRFNTVGGVDIQAAVSDISNSQSKITSLTKQINALSSTDLEGRKALIAARSEELQKIGELNSGLSFLSDSSKRTADLQSELSAVVEEQSKKFNTVSNFAFGTRDSRRNQVRTLRGVDAVSRGLSPNRLPEELRGSVQAFLREFSDVALPIFGGKTGRDIEQQAISRDLQRAGLDEVQANQIANIQTTDQEQKLIDEIKTAFNRAEEAQNAINRGLEDANTKFLDGLDSQFSSFLNEFQKLILSQTRDSQKQVQQQLAGNLANTNAQVQALERLEKEFGPIRNQTDLAAAQKALTSAGEVVSSIENQNKGLTDRASIFKGLDKSQSFVESQERVIKNLQANGFGSSAINAVRQLQPKDSFQRATEGGLGGLITRPFTRVTPEARQAGELAGFKIIAQEALADAIERERAKDSLAVKEALNNFDGTPRRASQLAQTNKRENLTQQAELLQNVDIGQLRSDRQQLTEAYNGLKGSIDGLTKQIKNIPVTPATGFNSGGAIPGFGSSDTVPAMLTPGEFVIRAEAARNIGINNLHALNSQGFNKGGLVQHFQDGGQVENITDVNSFQKKLRTRISRRRLSPREIKRLLRADDENFSVLSPSELEYYLAYRENLKSDLANKILKHVSDIRNSTRHKINASRGRSKQLLPEVARSIESKNISAGAKAHLAARERQADVFTIDASKIPGLDENQRAKIESFNLSRPQRRRRRANILPPIIPTSGAVVRNNSTGKTAATPIATPTDTSLTENIGADVKSLQKGLRTRVRRRSLSPRETKRLLKADDENFSGLRPSELEYYLAYRENLKSDLANKILKHISNIRNSTRHKINASRGRSKQLLPEVAKSIESKNISTVAKARLAAKERQADVFTVDASKIPGLNESQRAKIESFNLTKQQRRRRLTQTRPQIIPAPRASVRNNATGKTAGTPIATPTPVSTGPSLAERIRARIKTREEQEAKARKLRQEQFLVNLRKRANNAKLSRIDDARIEGFKGQTVTALRKRNPETLSSTEQSILRSYKSSLGQNQSEFLPSQQIYTYLARLVEEQQKTRQELRGRKGFQTGGLVGGSGGSSGTGLRLDAESIQGLNNAFSTFSSATDRLVKSVETLNGLQVQHQIGGSVEVIINGAETLSVLQEPLQELISAKIVDGINKMLAEKFPNAGTFRGE